MARKLKIVELYAGTARSVQPFLSWKRVDEPLLVDVSAYAAEVYKHNFPDAKYLVADVAALSPDRLGHVDILLGCPPCQGYSDSGRRLPDDPRNVHVTVFCGFIEKLRPLAVGMENVPLLAESSHFKNFTRKVEAAGYLWTATIANAALWGSCQSRQRLMFVAVRKEVGVAPKFISSTHGGDGLYFSYRYQKKCRISDDVIGMMGIAPGALRAKGAVPHEIRKGSRRKQIPTVGDILGGLPKISSRRSAEINHFAWAHTLTSKNCSIRPPAALWSLG